MSGLWTVQRIATQHVTNSEASMGGIPEGDSPVTEIETGQVGVVSGSSIVCVRHTVAESSAMASAYLPKPFGVVGLGEPAALGLQVSVQQRSIPVEWCPNNVALSPQCR